MGTVGSSVLQFLFKMLRHSDSSSFRGSHSICVSIPLAIKLLLYQKVGGDGLAQWLERWTGDSNVKGFESHQEHKKIVFPSQKGCADSLSVCPTPVCIRTHTKDHVRTI